MSRTVARLDSDQQYPDPSIPLSGIDFVATTGAATYTKIATGEFSLRLTAAATAYVTVSTLTGLIYRTGAQPDYQQAFGSARAGGALGLPVGWPQTISLASTVAGTFVSINVFSSVNFVVGAFVTVDTVASGVQEFAQITSIPDATHIVVSKLVNAHTTPFPVTQNLFTTPGPAQGRPPFAGLSQLTPTTSAPPKGINIKQITMIYIVNTAAATAPTIGLFATQYPHNAAPVTTTLIAQATNNLQTASQANPYSIPVPVPVANQGFIVTPNTIVSVEFDITTGAAATVDILGCIFTGSYAYN